MFAKPPFRTGSVIQIFHEDHIASITKSMGLFEVKVLPSIVNCVVKPCYFNSGFLVVVRPFLFSRKSALQQFQLAMPSFKQLRRLDENTITGCQKLFQTNIHTNRMTVGHWVWNSDLARDTDRGIPPVGFPQDSHLFDHKSLRNWSMQVNWNCSNLMQFYLQIRYWILLELRKKQRLKLPILLEPGKPKSSLLKVLPTFVQLLNSLLKNLGSSFPQSGKFFLGFRQVVELSNFARNLQVGRKNVLFFKRASINQTLTAIAAIFNLSKRIVECTTADFHPLNEFLFLRGIGIDSIAVGKCEHSRIIKHLVVEGATLIVNLRDIESLKLTAFHLTAKLSGVLAYGSICPLPARAGVFPANEIKI
jgi:hypothetical protein